MKQLLEHIITLVAENLYLIVLIYFFLVGDSDFGRLSFKVVVFKVSTKDSDKWLLHYLDYFEVQVRGIVLTHSAKKFSFYRCSHLPMIS